MTVKELGQQLRSGRTTARELVERALSLIAADRFRSFLTVNEEQALAEADQCDQERAAGIDRGPFHGIPVALKDLFCTRGIRTTCGSLIYRDFIPDFDATVVGKLRVGGAVSVGKTNLH